jgi:hypothetical protein
MYSEDLYASHIADHSVLIIYCALFAVTAIGVVLRMTFHIENREYTHSSAE